MKNLEIVCLHMWEKSWLDRMQTVELNQWTSGRLTNPKMTKMSMQCNSAVHIIDPARSISKSPTMSEDPSIVGLPTRHHQHHANRPHETSNQGAMRRNRLRARKCVSFAASVVGKGHPARLCPSADDCQDVDEVATEPSSDTDSDQFGAGLE